MLIFRIFKIHNKWNSKKYLIQINKIYTFNITLITKIKTSKGLCNKIFKIIK